MKTLKTILFFSFSVFFFACQKKDDEVKEIKSNLAVLKTLAIKEIPDYTLTIDEKKKQLKGYFAYNPTYVSVLENGATPVFKISEKAIVKVGDKVLKSGATKVRLKKVLTDRDIDIMGTKVTVKDTHFTGEVKVVAEDGQNTQQYILMLYMVGQAINTAKLVESYYPTAKYIGVHRSSSASKAQLDRVYNGVKKIMNSLDSTIVRGILKNNAKLLVLRDEAEATSEPYFMQLTPLEGIYVNNGGKDETLPDATTGIASSELEFTYLSVYYAISIEPSLTECFTELKAAYKEAADKGLFKPGDAYKDGYNDPIHAVASRNNVLKYGSFIFNLYKTYYTSNRMTTLGEYKIADRADILSKNPLAHAFMKKYFDK